MSQSSRGRMSDSTLPLSLEATLDEENKEVLARLNQQLLTTPPTRSPRGHTPPPYSSLLDVDEPAQRHGSIAGIGVGVTSPRSQRKPGKRLDPGDPSTWTTPAKQSSPTNVRTSTAGEASGSVASQGLPKIQLDSKQNFEQKYNFDMASMPLSRGGAKPTQERKAREGPSSGLMDAMTTPPRTHRGNSPNPVMLSPENVRSKQRASSGSRSDDNRRRLSNKSNSFSTADEWEDSSTRVLADPEGDEDAVAESSSDEQGQASSTDDESSAPERGRSGVEDENEPPTSEKSSTVERMLRLLPEKRTTLTLIGRDAPQSQGVRSLIEPLLSPLLPHDKSEDVHPPSSFGRSGPTAADFADDDDVAADIQKAKTLGISMSQLDDSIPDRHVRMIIRGEWSRFQDENDNHHNTSPRLYLACTDLSTEATYAMEWTIGTMLRDGDTLLAIYAIEDEFAPKEPEESSQVMAESAKAAVDASDTMATLTRQTTDIERRPMTKFVPAIDAPTLAESTNMSNMSKKEIERLKAIDEITQNFLKLVRKTPLQIRCMIEVIHCKSPKHLILNAIDELEPTVCVVGTRGRSSLKGVLLGSFSNYLVTKSSVPVMVARKRLKKPARAKVSASVKMSNNLTNSLMPRARRSLTQARID